jgi:DNA-binding NtrC family response regulator
MSKQAAAAPLPRSLGIRILVVDDGAVGGKAIAETLSAAGYDVVSAGTTVRALELVNDDEIGLVVSDIEMPDLFALELLEAMRLHRPSLPSLLVTSSETRDNLAEALNGRTHGLIAKAVHRGRALRSSRADARARRPERAGAARAAARTHADECARQRDRGPRARDAGPLGCGSTASA